MAVLATSQRLELLNFSPPARGSHRNIKNVYGFKVGHELQRRVSVRLMTLRGEVRSGDNNYNIWLRKLESFYTQKTGMKLYPGTLNVHLIEPKFYHLPQPVIRLEKEEYGGRVSVSIGKCKIFGREAFILRPDTDTGKDGYRPEMILEIATDIGLRDTFHLKDGDIVDVEVP